MEFEEYKIMYEAEDVHWWYRGLRGVMREMLGLDKPRRADMPNIVDAGCGTGGNMNALRRSGLTQVTGFDYNWLALQFCGDRKLARLARASITAVPFPTDTFDIAISCDVLNDAGTHNEAAALGELFRVLKPGGRLFLNLPAFNFLRSEHDRATDVARRYTRSEIKAKLAEAGFMVRRVTYWNTLLFPIVVFVRLARREQPQDLEKSARSDIAVPPGIVNWALTLTLSIERFLVRYIDLPFGSSVAVVAQKPR